MSLVEFILGRPLATSEERAEQIGVAKGVPIFGLDALGSAAYGPEAALTILRPLSIAGLAYFVPLSASIIVLLLIVFFSYRQTIAAYPHGGGSYTVARQNLGSFAGLLAGSALLIDYALDASVGISAGIGALTSAVPSLHPQTLTLCLVALGILTVINLRGVRETGAVFTVPTYVFLACMFLAIGIGIAKTIASGGHPAPVEPLPASTPAAVTAVSAWLLLKSFASGCTALTGVEAVSNGVQAFREDKVKEAQRTLGFLIGALAFMLAGIAWLVRAYHIVATDPNGSGYQSILSMMLGAVVGRNWFYYVSIASILTLLIFSANTAFADFPRVCRIIARDGYLPVSFANRGRRLVYTEGIVVLAMITAALLIGFGGITDRLIPLFAVGAFLAFTMSQAGMVVHWWKESKGRGSAPLGGQRVTSSLGGALTSAPVLRVSQKRGRGARRSMIVNGLGAVATGLTVLIVIAAKFTEGAWITLMAIPCLLALMYGVHRHYRKVTREVAIKNPIETEPQLRPLFVITMQDWTRVVKQALRFALTLSDDIKVVHVSEDEKRDDFCEKWMRYVEEPLKSANLRVPELVEIKSPYRFVVSPIVDYVIDLANRNPDRRIVAVIPELIERKWYYYFLHSQRASLLKASLLFEGNDRISVLNIPWYLKSA